jgi:hypothetical protein
MTKGTREKWTARIKEWRASGKSAEDFVADKDYSASSLRGAVSQVGTEKASPPPKQAVEGQVTRPDQPLAPVRRPARRPEKAPAPRFAEVHVRRTATPAAEMVVEVAGARIRVARGADMTLLGEVVRALQGAGR